MPWPIRFGPPPRITTFFLSDGHASHSTSPMASASYVEYMYGVCASNSAAHVSMRLNTAVTPSSLRVTRISRSTSPVRVDRRASEKPIILILRMASVVFGRPFAIMSASMSTISRMRFRNHGSNAVAFMISSLVKPWRMACAINSMRSGVCFEIALITAGFSGAPSMSISSKPDKPLSIEANAFCRLSWIVRPIDMTSPTDFIAVPSTGSAPGNFSNAKRGIFVTT